MRASHTFLGNYCMFLDSFVLRHVFVGQDFGLVMSLLKFLKDINMPPELFFSVDIS